MMRFLLVCVLMLCAMPSGASITDYVVKQWNIKDGLPSQSLKKRSARSARLHLARHTVWFEPL